MISCAELNALCSWSKQISFLELTNDFYGTCGFAKNFITIEALINWLFKHVGTVSLKVSSKQMFSVFLLNALNTFCGG